MIELASYVHTEHGRWRMVCYDSSMRLVALQRFTAPPAGCASDGWVTVRGMGDGGPGRLGIMVFETRLGASTEPHFHVANPREAMGVLSRAVEAHLTELRIEGGLQRLGEEHSPPADWQEKVLAATGIQRPSDLKHGPGGLGGPGPCDMDCAKCRLQTVAAASSAWAQPATPQGAYQLCDYAVADMGRGRGDNSAQQIFRWMEAVQHVARLSTKLREALRLIADMQRVINVGALGTEGRWDAERAIAARVNRVMASEG